MAVFIGVPLLAFGSAAAQDSASDNARQETGIRVSPPIANAVPPHPAPRMVTQWHVVAGTYECRLQTYLDRAGIHSIVLTKPFRGLASMDLQTQPVGFQEDGNFRPVPQLPTISVWEGEPIVTGRGQYKTFSPPVFRIRWNLDEMVMDKIRAVTDDRKGLYVDLPGLREKPFPLDINSAYITSLDECASSLGERLKQARPPGETAGVTDRDPVLNVNESQLDRIQYPSRALREDIEGTVKARVAGDVYGFPIDCDVVVTSGSTYLEEATCKDLKRFTRYYPALDLDGEATTGSYVRNVRWQLED
ncbi:energy transducer TonB [Alteriqipengyuania flavescens]|uniref:energy transducer TonB n=1 Tax=Alteriqipengyuania flavescens TaxID=3053610 RepID=UPI0025B451DD|nr:energy transducer TonB [Alteriqipengyuania flavescens]WJY17425.1 energy transducer TonB [Alteriqipengyuania flavescens]WJY23368.1 energy transducer TonB [Alteriqipengyuania flavescens]